MNLKEKIITEIKKIYDPEIPVNIYELGLIYDIKVESENLVKVKMLLHVLILKDRVCTPRYQLLYSCLSQKCL